MEFHIIQMSKYITTGISFLLILLIPNLTFAETKTFTKEYTYQTSEDDSRNSSRSSVASQGIK